MPGQHAPGLQLAPGQPRTLAYGQGIRRDMRLLEVTDEGMLEELMTGRRVQTNTGKAII